MSAQREYNAAVDFVDRNVAEGRGGKTACIDPSRNLTYGQLRDAAARVGPMLARFGVEPENRIAMILLDTVDFPILFWGAIRAGMVPIPLNTRLTAEQIRYVLEDSRAKVAFVSTALLPVVEEAAQGLPTLKRVVVVGGSTVYGAFDDDADTLPSASRRRRRGRAPTKSPIGSTPPGPPECRRASCTCTPVR